MPVPNISLSTPPTGDNLDRPYSLTPLTHPSGSCRTSRCPACIPQSNSHHLPAMCPWCGDAKVYNALGYTRTRTQACSPFVP
eukprot:6037393-Pleurochrysis_carterae.AAC.1